MPFKFFSTPKTDPGPPPSGGTQAWLQLVAAHLINALTWGYSASFGIYQLYYTRTLHLPSSQIAWIGSVQVFFTFILSTFSGRAADAGYASHAVLVGTALIVLGTFMTSLSASYWPIFLAQGVCTGTGMGLVWMPSVAVVGSYWAERRIMAFGLAASGSGTGSILFPLVVQHLLPRLGFARAVQVQGYIALAFAVIINLLLRPRLPPRRTGPLVEWRAFGEPTYMLFTMGVFLLFWALYFCFFFINTYATDVAGMTPGEAVNLLVVINAVGIPVRPLLGVVADRYFGALPTLIAAMTWLAVMLFVWIPVKSVGGLYAYAVFYGLATGATQGSQYTISLFSLSIPLLLLTRPVFLLQAPTNDYAVFVGGLASLTTDPSKLGVRFGMVCSILAFASLAGPPTAGALIQVDHGGFLKAQIWAGSVTMCAALFVSAALWTQIRRKRSARHGGLVGEEQDPISSEGGQVGDGRAEA
jgi:MCP family monocarboxylic acid transporter-like MFS transporter 3